MGIRESLLNTITSVSNGDFIRVVTSAGASSKATLANVMKSFETGLGAKSSLTTSDYIRVVGSDNALYKQGVQSVSDTIIAAASKVGSGSANDLTTAGMYWCTSANVSNLPSAGSYRVRVEYYDGAVNQYANPNGTSDIYFRTLANGSWTSWTKLPTRAEVDALSDKLAGWVSVYTGTLSVGEFASLSSAGKILALRFADEAGSSSTTSLTIVPLFGGSFTFFLPVAFGSTLTWARFNTNTNTKTLEFISAGDASIRLKQILTVL